MSQAADVTVWVSEKHGWKSIEDYVLYLKQKSAYEFVARYCENQRVLDFGCGSGYGSAHMSETARSVQGVDVNEIIVDFCSQEYQRENLSFQTIPMDLKLPFPDGAFDVITSFQVIEHIPETGKYLQELKRVLADGGKLIITTPNRAYRLLPFQKPWNSEHVREYSLKSLTREVATTFQNFEIHSVHGTDAIQAIEHKRVRQKPYKVYLTRPLSKLLKFVSTTLFTLLLTKRGFEKLNGKLKEWKRQKRQARKNNNGSGAGPTYLNGEELARFSTADYFVDDQHGRALDFMAVITK